MKRRDFFASLAAVGSLALPWERERIYSFGRPLGIVTIYHSIIHLVSDKPFSVRGGMGPPQLLSISNHFSGDGSLCDVIASGGVHVAGELITPGVDLRVQNTVTTDRAIAAEIRRQKAALDARGIWS